MIIRIRIGALIYSVMLWLSLLSGTLAHAQSTTIYQDDFEGTISGWSDNSSDFDPDVTNFLGRFAAGQTTTSRSFNVPAGATELVIEFDLYRFDSWDNFAEFGFDRFELEINGSEIFSLPFPDPQGDRSGSTGNVDWGHTNLTGSVELAFVSGQFWFDQIHRFVVTVNNPGATVNLTLRADLSQDENDESAGFDNFLVTADVDTNEILAVAETFADIDGSAGGVTSTVLASDTINGNILNPNDVTITSASSSSPNVTLNPSSGLITVAANTPAGTYTVDYEICENIELANCSSVTENLTVFVPGGSTGGGAGLCPAGSSALSGTFHAPSAGSNFASQAVADLTVGAPVAEGQLNNNNVTANLFGGFIFTMNLTGDTPNVAAPEFVPAGETVLVALAGFFGTSGLVDISTSIDGTNFTSLGSSGAGGSEHPAFQSEVIRYDAFVIPSGGARFLRVQQSAGAVRLDGVIFNTQCQMSSTPVTPVTSLEANKAVAIFDPQAQGLYAIPGNDVVYTISVDNTGAGDVDSDSIFIVDNLPPEIIFYNGDIDDGGPETDPVTLQDTGGGLTFNFNTDVRFSNAAFEPTSFASCIYTPSAGYDENVNFVCLNPKGALLAGANLSIGFRARIE